MYSKPLVYVITVYHNREAYVDLSMRSLLNQSYENLKIIAVDDGSSDNTLKNLRALESERLEVRGQANKGFTHSIISTLAELDADFVAIHGSGDISHPDRIARQVEALTADPNAAFCCSGSRTIDVSSGRQFDRKMFNKRQLGLADIQHGPPFTHGTVMLRMACYKEAGGYDPYFQFASDWDLWGKMLRSRYAVFIQDILYDQLAQEDGATFNAKKSMSQIRYNLLIQRKLQMAAEDAEVFMEQVRGYGIEDIIPAGGEQVAYAAYRRAVKLLLMGRSRAAEEMLEMSSARICLGLREQATLGIARLLSNWPVGRRLGTALARVTG